MTSHLKTTPFDPAEHLDSDENITEYLREAFETGERDYIAHAIGVAARAKGMSQIARDSGVNRESLYRALSHDGNPQLDTLLSVMKSLGVTLSAKPFV